MMLYAAYNPSYCKSLLFSDLVTLRKKFEEDKKKLEALKTQRKFKPFWTCE